MATAKQPTATVNPIEKAYNDRMAKHENSMKKPIDYFTQILDMVEGIEKGAKTKVPGRIRSFSKVFTKVPQLKNENDTADKAFGRTLVDVLLSFEGTKMEDRFMFVTASVDQESFVNALEVKFGMPSGTLPKRLFMSELNEKGAVQATPEPAKIQDTKKRGEEAPKDSLPFVEGESFMSKFELVKKAESPFAALGGSKTKMLFLSATRNVVIGENSFKEERVEGYIPSFVTFKERVVNGVIQKGQFESVIALENEDGTMEYQGIDVHVIPHCEIEKKDGKVVRRIDSPILAAIKEGKKFFTLIDKLSECRRILRKDDKTGKLVVEVYVKNFKIEKPVSSPSSTPETPVKKEEVFEVSSLLTEEEMTIATKAGERLSQIRHFFDLKESNVAMKDIDVTLYNDIMEFVVKPDCKSVLQPEIIAETISLSSFLKETVLVIQNEIKGQEEEKVSEVVKLVEAKSHLASKKEQLSKQEEMLKAAQEAFRKENEPVIRELEIQIAKQEEVVAKMKVVFAKVKNEGEAANTLLQKYETPLVELKARHVELTSSESFVEIEKEIQELTNDIKALEFMMPKDESSKYDAQISKLQNQIKVIEKFAKDKMLHICAEQMKQLTFEDLDILHESLEIKVVISEDEEYLDDFTFSSARLFKADVDVEYLTQFICALNRLDTNE